MPLPINVVNEDRDLRQTMQQGESAARTLILLRWHWTLDESNANRVSIHEYARRVEVDRRAIQRDAQAGALMKGGDGAVTPNEARERVQMTQETAAAVEAVADAHGVSFSQARKAHRNEAVRIRETARETAEQKGTTTLAEIPAVAAFHAKAVKADRKKRAEHNRKHPIGYLRMEAKVIKARRLLSDALQISGDYDLDREEQELLQDTISNVRKLLDLFDRAISNRYDQSWKSELRVLEGGRAS